jgi:hypothetical protein
MYSPLVVTAEGDLDGDGVSNLDQYRSGFDLRGNKSADTDDDGLANTTEDAWGKIYHGQLSKYRFADAYADPDGDGLLTIEELSGTWGSSSVKDSAAVITNPFLKSTGPNTSAANSALTYKTSSRAVPTSTSEAKVRWSWRSSSDNYSAWMNDGLLRRAYRESYDPITKKYPATFFSARYLYTLPPASIGEINGSDHLPAGYLIWLSTQGITLPVPAASAPAIGQIPPPNNETRAKLAALSFPGGNAPNADSDQDSMPNVWEAAYQLDWRNADDASLSLARSAVAARIAALPLTAAERTEIARLQSTGTGISALIQQNLDKQSAAHLLPDGRSTLLINEYAVTKPAVPPALPASPAATASAAVKAAYEVRRAAWQAGFIALHTWQILTEIDLDHDGLVNADEYSLGLNPQIADYSRTSSRDTDGDGFTDAQELAAGTDAKKATSKPVLALQIISGAGQSGTIFQTLGKPIHVQSIFKGPNGGFCPAPGTTIEITAPNNHTLLAPAAGFGNEPASPEEWRPKTLRFQADTQGYAKIAVKLPNVAGNLSLAVVAIKDVTKSASAPCVLKVVAPALDTDGDGMPNAWETATANGLNKLSALDAEVSPLHYGYHRDTPMGMLPVNIAEELQEVKDSNTSLIRFPAVYTTNLALTQAQHKMLTLVDPDHDGVSNLLEFLNNKKPKTADGLYVNSSDFDGDGFSDLEEISLGTDMFSRASTPPLKLFLISGAGQKVNPGQALPSIFIVKASLGSRVESIPLHVTCGASNQVRAEGSTEWQNELNLTTSVLGQIKFYARSASDTEPGTQNISIGSSVGSATLLIPFTAQLTTAIKPPGTNPNALPPLGSAGRPHPLNGPKIVAYHSDVVGFALANYLPGQRHKDQDFSRFTRMTTKSEVSSNYRFSKNTVFVDPSNDTSYSSTMVATNNIRGSSFSQIRVKNPVITYHQQSNESADFFGLETTGGFSGTESSSEYGTSTVTPAHGGMTDTTRYESSAFSEERFPFGGQHSQTSFGSSVVSIDGVSQAFPYAQHDRLIENWDYDFSDSVSPTTYTSTLTGTAATPVDLPQGQTSSAGGSYRQTYEVTYSDPITPEQIHTGMISDIGTATWSEWEKKELSDFIANSGSAETVDTSIGWATRWQLSYELPENANPSEYAPAIIVITHRNVQPNGETMETKETITLNPGKESEVYTCDATPTLGGARYDTASLLPVEFELPGAAYADGSNPDASSVGTRVFPVSNPSPVIKFESVSASVNQVAGTIEVRIDGVEVRDPMADNYPDGQGGEIAALTVWLIGSDGDDLLTSVNLTRKNDGAQKRWRQHPKCFSCGVINFNIPLRSGTQVIELRSSANLIGNIASAQALITTWKQSRSPTLSAGQTASARLSLPSVLNSSATNSITLSDLRLGTIATLTETSPESRDFLGQINGTSVTAYLPDGQIGTPEVQTLDVELALGDPDDQPVGMIASFSETTATSNVYEASINWAMEIEGETTWQVRAMHGEVSAPGSYSPIALRMSTMDDPEAWRMVIGSHEIALAAGIDGKMHLKDGSEGFITITHETKQMGAQEFIARGINASGEAFEHSLGTQIPEVPITLRPPGGSGVSLIDLGTVPVTAPMIRTTAGEAATPLRARQGQPNQANLWHLDNVAWIEPHSNNNGPKMPQLRARLEAPAQGGAQVEVRWRLEVAYNRPFNGSRPGAAWQMAPPRLNMDYVMVPGDRTVMDGTPELQGWTPGEWLPRPGKVANAAGVQEAWTGWMPIAQDWDISADPAWVREISWGFFGGEAVLKYQTRTSGGAASQTQRFDFRIGGKNPNDTDCQTYIQTHDIDSAGFEHWYAYAIAKHETYGYNLRSRVPRRGQVAINPGNIFGNPTDNTLGLYFNHFWEGSPGGYRGAGVALHNDDQTRDRRRLDARGRVMPGNDGIPDGTGGFGLFQLTYEQGEDHFYMPRGWIWNWQQNVEFGIEKCRTKRIQSFPSVPDVPGRTYARHAVPRVRNPDNVGTRTDNSDGDPMNSAVTDGVVTGADANNNTAPNGFPASTAGSPDYRKAEFDDREGYLILNTIRRFNGGNYCEFRSTDTNTGIWRFRRWRGDGESSNGQEVDAYERKSYVDAVFKEIAPGDVPQAYRP